MWTATELLESSRPVIRNMPPPQSLFVNINLPADTAESRGISLSVLHLAPLKILLAIDILSSASISWHVPERWQTEYFAGNSAVHCFYGFWTSSDCCGKLMLLYLPRFKVVLRFAHKLPAIYKEWLGYYWKIMTTRDVDLSLKLYLVMGYEVSLFLSPVWQSWG